MKKRTKFKIKLFASLLVFASVLIGVGYVYLNSRLENITANDTLSGVPYYTQTPENSCVLLMICEDNILLDLKFEQELMNVVFLEYEPEYYGYSVDYTIKTDYEFAGYLVDLVGGIEMDNMRYTGVQVSQMLEYTNASKEQKKEITEKIINGISNTVLTKDDLHYIIENSETDLKFAECFLWSDFLPDVCKFVNFVN